MQLEQKLEKESKIFKSNRTDFLNFFYVQLWKKRSISCSMSICSLILCVSEGKGEAYALWDLKVNIHTAS